LGQLNDAHFRPQLCGVDVELPLDETHFSHDATAILEERGLAFAQGVHDLEALDRGVGGLHGFEATHRLDQLFQLAVIGLDDVVEIFDLPVNHLLGQLALLEGIALNAPQTTLAANIP
jgi:hypothetical protein